MTMQYYDTVDLVLDDAWEAVCNTTKATSNFLWKCDAPFHGDQRHYFIRVV